MADYTIQTNGAGAREWQDARGNAVTGGSGTNANGDGADFQNSSGTNPASWMLVDCSGSTHGTDQFTVTLDSTKDEGRVTATFSDESNVTFTLKRKVETDDVP